MSVTAVANETGFCDGAHFSRQFKDSFGVPPSTIRVAPPSALTSSATAEASDQTGLAEIGASM
jgi:AraC-like DNA-binding protein